MLVVALFSEGVIISFVRGVSFLPGFLLPLVIGCRSVAIFIIFGVLLSPSIVVVLPTVLTAFIVILIPGLVLIVGVRVIRILASLISVAL